MNTRSLKTCNNTVNKLAELESLVYLTKCDILSVTETWLNCNIKDRDILNNEYTIFRKDRANDKRGGGVLLAVNSNITSREVSDIPVGDSEILLVEVSPSHCSKMFFCYML